MDQPFNTIHPVRNIVLRVVSPILNIVLSCQVMIQTYHLRQSVLLYISAKLIGVTYHNPVNNREFNPFDILWFANII
jgi:hypothetical protein